MILLAMAIANTWMVGLMKDRKRKKQTSGPA
jgi:hypothetical protein